jgi:putrescine transport system substrate-binding protein
VSFLHFLVFLMTLGATPGLAASPSPFAPSPSQPPKRVRILAFTDYFDPLALTEFEHASGYQVAYDAYDSPESISAKLHDGPYDLLILPGPALERQIAAGALKRFDRSRVTNASRVSPLVAAKLATYDTSGSYGIAYAWFADGLLFDSGKVPALLGAEPNSWAALFAPEATRKLFDCGIAAPNARDELFVAAWRYLGIDPAKAAAPEIRRAAGLLSHAKAGFRVFGAVDVASALASGSACLGMGSESDAKSAVARARAAGQPLDIRFAVPREGGPVLLDAIALPRDAPDPDGGYELANFLLRPDIAARNAAAANVISSEAAGSDSLLKRLWPSGALPSALATLVDKEWAQLRAEK